MMQPSFPSAHHLHRSNGQHAGNCLRLSPPAVQHIVAQHGSWIGRHACPAVSDTRVRGADILVDIMTRHYITFYLLCVSHFEAGHLLVTLYDLAMLSYMLQYEP